MKITLGCKCWSGGNQYGFRIYAPDIRTLVPYLVLPSADGRWSSLEKFYQQVVAGHSPSAYSRSVTISDGSKFEKVTATIAKHGRSVQGYITAPLGSWLYDFVAGRLDEDLECECLVQHHRDFILIPAKGKLLSKNLDSVELAARRNLKSYLRQKKYGPPPNSEEIGLYFETVELDHLQEEGKSLGWEIYLRYPAIDSEILYLRENNVSCDIDVVTRKRKIVRCVEVKSISGAPGSAFNLTRREWESRAWCFRSNIPYEIVVYYHVRCQIIERRVIPATASMRHEPSGYWCFPP